VYLFAMTLGQVITFVMGGAIASRYGWRAAALATATPSMIAAFVMILTLPEPARKAAGPDKTSQSVPSFRETLAFLGTQRAAMYLIAISAVTVMTTTTTIIWLTSFYIRIFHMPLGRVGAAVGVGAVFLGSLGTLFGGMVTDRLAKRDERWKIGVTAVAILLATFFVVAMALTPSLTVALALMVCWSVLVRVQLGPVWGLFPSLVPPRMRGRMGSILLAVTVLIGYGVGPFLAGFLSERLAPRFGVESIRYSLVMINLFNIVAVYWCIRTTTCLRAGLSRIENAP